MKKGQSGVPQWVVFLILGVSLTMIIGATFYTILVDSQKSKQSFEDLTEKINAMEDGDTLDYSLYMGASDILISFSGGNNYVGPSSSAIKYWFEECEQGETIKISESCGQYPCLCICDTSLQYEFEESCTQHALVCYPFTKKDITFYDPTCNAVYKKGNNNGILQVHLQLKDKVLSFCENKDCITDEQTDMVQGFESFVDNYKSCLASKSTCSCDLDYTFLEQGYTLNFYADKIELYNAISKVPIVTSTFSTKIDSNIPELKFTNLISLYQFELFDYTIPEYSGTEGVTYFVASTSTDNIIIIGEYSEMPLKIDTTLLLKENKLYFTSEDLSQYTSCDIDEHIVL